MYDNARIRIPTIAMGNCTREGEIRVIGSNTTRSLSGRMELCYESTWRAVCETMWDRAEAMVVCRQFGFPQEGMPPW